MAYHVPEGMTTMEAALVEPAAVGMHAAILGEARLGKSIVILGAGTIGLMVLQACKSLGATDITVVDVMDKDLTLQKNLEHPERSMVQKRHSCSSSFRRIIRRSWCGTCI